MKVIDFKINGNHGRVHVDYIEQVVPMLRRQGLIDDESMLAVDWKNNGRYELTWLKKYHAVCPYCGTANFLSQEDMGFEEFECGRCDGTYTIPETVEELPEYNLENMRLSTEGPPPSHYRVMLKGEDGVEYCLKNGVPAEYAELVCDGYQTRYTEGGRCFLEPEETYNDMLRNRYNDMDDNY